jgi:hypothetical protein
LRLRSGADPNPNIRRRLMLKGPLIKDVTMEAEAGYELNNRSFRQLLGADHS